MPAGSVSPLTAALGCKCPRCGQGPLFKGFLTVAERCPVCDLDLSEVDSGDGPAVFLIFILGFTVVPLALWLGIAYDLPDWAPIAIGGVLIVLLTAVLIRPAKAYIVALQYRHRSTGR
ncbi:DUF983 domain-containing protein [Inquilinus limosus]|uniref:DUF983 domain-containing protein n=1 Tax=Inquilinus limosus TaxID=171674 RepID=UPI0004089FBF|nr:DUF983 domain-containing protein [Inquilinus limosus]